MKSKKQIVETQPLKYSNLTINEQKAMQEPQSRDDIVITTTDEGGAVVIQDVEDYVEEAERQLKNKENYRKIIYDPTTVNNEAIHKVISRFQKENLLVKNISEGLKTENSKTSHFCLKPKVHKECNPGRPVISSINCHISKFLNIIITIFNQLLKKSHHTCKVKPIFLGRLTKLTLIQTTHGYVFLDVKSLYTNIPNTEGIKSVKTSLDKYSRQTDSTKVVATFLVAILTLNNFIFNFRDYLQIKDCTMGTIYAPSYANIFMYHFERKCIYPFIKTFSLIYLRFIDAIFFIWTARKQT